MNNKELYKKTFSNIKTSAALELEDVMKNNTGKHLRVRRSLLALSIVLTLLFAMSAITYAATDGKIVDYVQVFINGEQVESGEYIVKGEDGQEYSVEVDADSLNEEFKDDGKVVIEIEEE